MPGPPPAPDALELGSLVKVKHSGLWLYGVVKDIKADTHPGFVAVEMVSKTCLWFADVCVLHIL